MRKVEKARRVAATLSRLYPDVSIPLAHADPFTLLVAAVLSAQTTDRKVNDLTPALFRLAPDPRAMAALGRERILELIRPLGLAPTKAGRLEALSRILIQEHGGRVPAQMEALERLPGVGHKTASVVVSQAFGVPAFPVDTHVHRLAWRWGLSDGSGVRRTEADLKRLFPREDWNVLHLRIIRFGRERCPALRHDLDGCPICSWAAPAAVRRAGGRYGR